MQARENLFKETKFRMVHGVVREILSCGPFNPLGEGGYSLSLFENAI